MKTTTMQRQWDRIKAELATRWGELTDDEVLVLEGRLAELEAQLGLLFERARGAVSDGFDKMASGLERGVDHVRGRVADRGASLLRKVKGLRKRARKLLQ
ncbi:MAG TPA: hypothetical protein PK095_08695 [Myxococcota bacterium]|nr:hypothetical protein [Myxococcota bacterium]